MEKHTADNGETPGSIPGGPILSPYRNVHYFAVDVIENMK